MSSETKKNNVPLFSGYTDVYYFNRDSDKFIVINQGGSSCLSPDTLVETKLGSKRISEIAIGDEVKTYDPTTEEIKYSLVTNTFKFDNTKPTVEVTLKSGKKIVCTDDHKFYINGVWVPIISILYGYVSTEKQSDLFLNSQDIVYWKYVDVPTVHDIEVKDTHNYFLNVGDESILVHNSSKTYSIMQLICTMAIEQRLTIHIVGQDFPNLYIGPIADLKTLIADSEILRACLRNPNLDKGPFKFKNGSIIKFVTVQTQQDAKSGKRDVLFINEANGLSYDIAFELIARRKKKVFIDFNPNARFWVHYELVGQPDVDFIISNFTHNQFLPEKIKDQIFQWKEKYERTRSVYWKNKWMVYGLGKTGSVEGVVFDDINYTNFFPLAAKHVTYGLDFGFKNNHTALVKLGYYNKAMYGKEILYEQKLNSFQLAERLLAIGITKNDKIIADPANDEAITILQSKGFNIVPAKKGADSIKAGIELIQAVPLFLTNDSHNWQQEAENYKYKKDTNGKFTNTPIDDYNDCFVAGTQVLTIDGPKAIETIEVGEQVLTSEGYNTVVHTWDNGVREVSEYKLIFEDREIVVTCTDKHKIKTTTGWKQIQDLQEQDILYLCNTSMENLTGCTQTKNTFITTAYLYIKRFGNITMGKYLKDTTYTILMKILITMTLATLPLWKRVNTFLTTVKTEVKNILSSSIPQGEKQQKYGIKVMKAGNGTENMQKDKSSEILIMVLSSVTNAVQSIKLKIQHTFFAQTIVNLNGEGSQGLMMKPEVVLGVPQNLLAINTANKNSVHIDVLQKIHAVKKGKQPTYDLMVENCHEYFVDNQLLVSNCWDAARYVYVELFGVRLKKADKTSRQKFVRKVSVV